MSKVPLTHLVNLQNETTAVNLINNNTDTIENGFENTLSRDGTQPNSMNAPLDMNSFRILNLSAPVSPTEPVRLGDVNVNEIIVTSSRSFSTKSLAAASTIPISVSTIDTLGYSIPGDNGGASYKRISDPSSSSPAYFQTVDGQWWGLIDTECKVEMFGAQRAPIGTNPLSISNSTIAVQACIDYVSVNSLGNVIFSAGMYGIQSVNISTNAIYIKGAGTLVTQILHILPGSPNCFNFSAGSSELFDTGISDLTILTNDFTNSKVGINVRDVSTFYCKNVAVESIDGSRYRSTGGGAIGLHIQGRELGRVENFLAFADTPLSIDANPNFAPISLDSWVFEDCFFHTDLVTKHCILINDGVNLFNTTFCGRQNWIGGKDGLHWVDTTTTAESVGLAISGSRVEQANDSTGYHINIQHHTGLKSFNCFDCSGGGSAPDGRNAFFLRKVVHPTIRNYTFLQSNLEALNLDATALTVSIDNCSWWNAATTTISGLSRAEAQAITTTSPNESTTIPATAFYTSSGNPILVRNLTADNNVGANTFNNVGVSIPASTAFIVLGSGKTFTVNNSLGLSGTDSTTHTFPTTNSTLARTDAAQTFTGTQTFSSTISGNISGSAGSVTTIPNLTGDVTSVGNTTTLTNAPVIAKVLTGYTSGAGVVSASDSILSAIQKLNGNDATNANLTGDVTSVGNATTLTNAPVIAKVLTGYTSGAGTVSSADSILSAIQKLNGNDATNANLTGPITSVGNATSIASQTGTGTTFAMSAGPTFTGTTTVATLAATTINAFTLAGTISGGGNNLNNIIVGAVTPLAITGTTITANTSISSPTHTASGALTFQSNGSTFAGAISTGQQWFMGSTSNTSPTNAILTLSKNTAVLPNTLASSALQIGGADGTGGVSVGLQAFNNTTPSGQGAIHYFRARGTAGTPAAVQSGDSLGANFAFGYATSGAAGYVTSAGSGFIMRATDNYTTSAAGALLELYTTPTGGATLTLAATLQSSGGFSVGTATDPGIGAIIANTSVSTPLYKSVTAPTAVSGAGPILTGSGSTINSRMKVNLNGTDYWIPCSTTAF